MWEPFHVGLEPQPKHKGFICCVPANQDFSRLSISEPTCAVVMVWWWIHMPIHSIRRLSDTLHIKGLDVGTIPCGFGASTKAQGLHLLCPSESGFQLTSQIWANKCGCNGMMMDPYAHPQHMKVVKHLSYDWRGWGNHSMWVWSLNQCTRASFAVPQRIRISADFPNLSQLFWL